LELRNDLLVGLVLLGNLGGALEELQLVFGLVVLGGISSEEQNLCSSDDAIMFSQSGELGLVGLLLSVEGRGAGSLRCGFALRFCISHLLTDNSGFVEFRESFSFHLTG
jgi:hypothetical protein